MTDRDGGILATAKVSAWIPELNCCMRGLMWRLPDDLDLKNEL
jgi:hypothetical protein